ncbi:aspartyl-tRNA synthetase, partial [Trifolium medium]|nr:aspartyl-tRNA synthetase [Trifolium medium]
WNSKDPEKFMNPSVNKIPLFIGESSQFYLWKDEEKNHFLRTNEVLWDIVQNGVNLAINSEGMVEDRKSLTETQKQDYKNHHKAKYMMMQTISQAEFNKLSETSTTKAIYESLCDLYERSS